MTPDDDARHTERAERLRRETARRRRQAIAALIAAAVLVVAGVALAWRSWTPAPAANAVSAATTPTVPSQSTETSGSAPTTSSVAASTSVETSRAADTTRTGTSNTATTTVTVATIKPLKPAPGVKTIVVDKSEQRVTLYKADGTPVDTFRCASGVVYPRIGTYKVYGHRKQSWSMYDSSTFYYFTTFVKSDKGNNIGFHSIPTIDGKLVGKLGVPVSHGCVRLDKAKAKFVYGWAPVGTRVVVKK